MKRLNHNGTVKEFFNSLVNNSNFYSNDSVSIYWKYDSYMKLKKMKNVMTYSHSHTYVVILFGYVKT